MVAESQNNETTMGQNQKPVEEFTAFFNSNVLPLIEEENQLKDKFRNIFWTHFWAAVALVCVNGLFVLFNALIYHKTVTFSQFWFVFLIAILFALEPLLSYHKEKKTDIFGTFLQFFGNWQHDNQSRIITTESECPILPPHNAQIINHLIRGEYNETAVRISSNIWYNGKKRSGKGLLIDISLATPFASSVLLVDKSGSRHFNKTQEFYPLKEEILIPSSNYFKIFTPNGLAPHKLLCSAFFEKILDIKDDFKARKMNVMAEDRRLLIMLDKAEIYFKTDSLWNKSNSKTNFEKLDKQINDILYLIDLVNEQQR